MVPKPTATTTSFSSTSKTSNLAMLLQVTQVLFTDRSKGKLRGCIHYAAVLKSTK
jgi:hypothetical protein